LEEKIAVVLKPEVIRYLDDLVIDLFENDYFLYKENAINYVDKIFISSLF
jgi:hypothetical protein